MAKEILIAESNKADQGEFKKIFEATEYNLVFSENGEQALLRLKLFKPDIIIAEPRGKERGGLDVCKAVKSSPEFRDIPVILLTDIYEELSEGERLSADGIITRPLREDEILNMVDRLIGEKARGAGRDRKSMDGKGEAPSFNIGEFLLDETGEEGEEEVIELLDVVEEPGLKMSIEEFIAPKLETPSTGIPPLDSWEKLIEEKPAEGIARPGTHEKESEARGLRLPLEDEGVPEREVSDQELLEKIELDEILQKVEQLAPSIEKEWPPELPKKPTEKPPELIKATPEERPRVIERPAEKDESLAAFEAALKRGIGVGPMEKEVPPAAVQKPREEPEEEIGEEIALPGPTAETGFVEETKAKEEELFEEVEEEGEAVEVLEEKDLKALEVEGLKELEEEGLEELEEEPKKELKEKGMPESLFEEIETEEVRRAKEAKDEEFELFEEGEAPGVAKEEFQIPEEAEEEALEMLRKVEVSGALKEEIRAFERLGEEGLDIFEGVTAPAVRKKEVVPPSRAVERQAEEVIMKGTREMLEGFLTKLVPEMTESIMNLTIERIERMVREIVPEIAERMIQEEIKRLQKGEKE
ncbi:MAG: response regulator [Syntrophaceae bacterium]|nr:response regulator [Syntrophaceae bacterium]